MLQQPIIQVAGVIDRAEAELLIACGVRYLGFPLRLPINDEDLSEAEAAALIATLPEGVEAVLITYLDRADAVLDLCSQLGVSIVQLHGAIATEELSRIKAIRPDLQIIKSLVVRGDNLAELEALIAESAEHVDAYITDSFDPSTGAEGATGKTHDWAIDRALVAASPRPLILAGGLNPDNVRAAILATGAAGVDVHTGIEGEDGRKTLAFTERFISEALAGFSAIGE